MSLTARWFRSPTSRRPGGRPGHAGAWLALAAAVVLVVIGMAVFTPWKLVVDVTVDEARPPSPAPTSASTTNIGGRFQAHAHPTAGTALVLDAGRSPVVRFEDFETDNGPDVVVYLSAEDPAATELGPGAVFLGELKGNVGNQNYTVPDGVDVARYRSVVVWCRRFGVSFGAAPLVGA